MDFFCSACGSIADPRYFTNNEHLCREHWVEFYATKEG